MIAFILSQPRSGSTVLSAMLDKRKGVICMPESSFPQVLGEVSARERSDKIWMGAMYRGSTFPTYPDPPTPLSVEEAAECMEKSDGATLMNLGRAVAEKLGRTPQDVLAVIWKTTRTIGMQAGPLSTGGKFIVLRRNLLNVYDSQFRVHFGVRNRNPWRYAIFAHSYECAFEKLPAERVFEIEYETIPEKLGDMIRFLEIPDQGEWEGGKSSIDYVAKSGAWLANATREFQSTDREKRERLPPSLAQSMMRAAALTQPLRSFLGPVRRHYDVKSLNDIRNVAREQIAKAGLKTTIL